MIPVGSLTAVQEIVNGSVTLAPSVGETADGAGGVAATALPPALTHRIIANKSVRHGRPDVRNFITHPHDRPDIIFSYLIKTSGTQGCVPGQENTLH
jgi:hypothetical protein